MRCVYVMQDCRSRSSRPGCAESSVRAGREFAAELVEEIEDEADLVHRGGLFCAWGLQHGKAFAVGVQIKVGDAPSEGGGGRVGKLAGRPELRLVGAEGNAGSGIGGHHNLAVRRTIKE